MDRANVWIIRFPHEPYTERLEARAIAIEIVGLKNKHIRRVAVPLDMPTRRRVVARWRDELEKLIANREQGIFQTKLGDIWIAVTDLDAECCSELINCLRKISCSENDLAN